MDAEASSPSRHDSHGETRDVVRRLLHGAAKAFDMYVAHRRWRGSKPQELYRARRFSLRKRDKTSERASRVVQ